MANKFFQQAWAEYFPGHISQEIRENSLRRRSSFFWQTGGSGTRLGSDFAFWDGVCFTGTRASLEAPRTVLANGARLFVIGIGT